MERKTPFVEGEYYHLYNRGVEKRKIFLSAADYKRFMMLLYLANSEEEVRMENILRNTSFEEIFLRERGAPLVAIGAFCLMPNHFHLLVTPLKAGGLSRFMLKIQTGYSMYFNTKNERNGSLFQGPFKSEHTASDTYLKYLFSYIHLNPAKLQDHNWKERPSLHRSLREFVERYPYSSFKAHLTNLHTITDPTPFPHYFSSPKEIERHITDWLLLDAR